MKFPGLALLLAVTLLLGGCAKHRTVEVGDCLSNLKISQPKIVSCERNHAGEVVGIYTAAAASYPGEKELSQQAKEYCEKVFLEHMGEAVNDSVYDLVPLVPTPAGWDEHSDRDVLCVARSSDGTPLVGSLQQD